MVQGEVSVQAESGASKQKKTKLAIVMNIVAPYRLPVYAALAEHFETVVFHGGNESNRNWKLDVPAHLRLEEVFTVQIPVSRRTGVAGVSARSYFHLNLGLLWRLPFYRPDIVISNELGLRTVICMLYAYFARVPLWVWWGGTMHSERNIGGFKKSARLFLCRRIHRWISYGASSTEYLQSVGAPRADILQIQNCVPHETFLAVPPGSPLWFNDRVHPVLLTVGQLIDRKGLDRLIESCARVAARGREFTLVIVGEGPQRQALLDLAEKTNLKNLLILPNQSQAKLNEIYKSSQVFVFPTNEDVWGLVANEAVWAGLPLLCSRYAGCASEIVPEENVFDPLLPQEFDAVIERALDGAVSASDRSLLLTWQAVSELITRSLATGIPVR
jgi:glycosyltransferase involved in cell wall biosynthesis